MERVSNHPLDAPAYKRRSLNQNGYYHGVVIGTLCRELRILGSPIPSDAMHGILKYQFLSTDTVDTETGEVIPAKRSTRKLNTKQFGEYILQVQHWAAEKFGIYIPDPNEIIHP